MTTREINNLIAEKVMQFAGCDNCGLTTGCGCPITGIGSGRPDYCGDPAASKRLRDKMRLDGWSYQIGYLDTIKDVFACEFLGVATRQDATADTEEIAVALAALKAVGVVI